MSENILSQYVREQAHWRERKAEEYPNDERNEQSAEALNSLADYLEHEDAAINANVTFLCEQNGAGMERLRLGEDSSEMVSQYGFHFKASSLGQHEEFLEELSIQSLMDIYDKVGELQEPDHDRGDVLFSCEVDAAMQRVFLPRRYWERRSHMVEHELEQAIGYFTASDPRTKQGKRVAVLLKETVSQVRMDAALRLAEKQQGRGRDAQAWMKISVAAVGLADDPNWWPEVWPALQGRCEAEGIVYPFDAEMEQGLTAGMEAGTPERAS